MFATCKQCDARFTVRPDDVGPVRCYSCGSRHVTLRAWEDRRPVHRPNVIASVGLLLFALGLLGAGIYLGASLLWG